MRCSKKLIISDLNLIILALEAMEMNNQRYYPTSFSSGLSKRRINLVGVETHAM